MNATLESYIRERIQEFAGLSPDRRSKLQALAEYIHSKRTQHETAQLVFICTHNSRRSHFGQVWAAVAAAHFGIGESVLTYSGGTVATAFNPRAVAALERAGFATRHSGGENPHYVLRFDSEQGEMECFSKLFDHPTNPQRHFAAIMTCSEADENCPFIPGADFRLSLPYTDPKESDGSPMEIVIYDERCAQIATEMLFVFSQLRAPLSNATLI